MYCPKCRGEFREGYTICKKCDEPLVDVLPPEPEKPPTPNLSPLITRFNRNIEKWLKYGGIIYIFIGVLYDITNFIYRTFLSDNRFTTPMNPGTIAANIFNVCYVVLNTALWGLFFFGFGKIIEILREGFNHEE